jgi:hypothetical protein
MLYNYFLGNSTYISAGEVTHRQVQVLMHWTKLVQLLMHTQRCLINYNSKRTKGQEGPHSLDSDLIHHLDRCVEKSNQGRVYYL